MIDFPNAKINIGLHITGKRSDGYHNIESLFYPIPWKDGLEILSSEEFKFHTYGLSIDGIPEDNLCVKAYQLLQKDHHLPPVAIYLHKTIPMGAGMGGGSSDGAFCLKMLNIFFKLKLSTQKLKEYALELGSDCPFFIENKPAFAKGRGEKLIPSNTSLQGMYLIICNPEIHVSTKDAYENIIPNSDRKLITILNNTSIKNWKENVHNDFEKPILKKYPQIRKIKTELYEMGAIYASMTGTGSTVYGIFNTPPKGANKFKILTL